MVAINKIFSVTDGRDRIFFICICIYLFITKLYNDYKVCQWTNDIDDEHLIIGANK